MAAKRFGRVEFFAEHASYTYVGGWDFGIQVSLKCLAFLIWKWTVGVMCVERSGNEEATRPE